MYPENKEDFLSVSWQRTSEENKINYKKLEKFCERTNRQNSNNIGHSFGELCLNTTSEVHNVTFKYCMEENYKQMSMSGCFSFSILKNRSDFKTKKVKIKKRRQLKVIWMRINIGLQWKSKQQLQSRKKGNKEINALKNKTCHKKYGNLKIINKSSTMKPIGKQHVS